MSWFDILAPVTEGIRSYGNYVGTKAENEARKEIAREQMDFQREMSNTAFQRSRADMIKAGINPMLMAKLGGASSPGGVSYDYSSPMKAATNSAADAVRNQLDIQKMRADVDYQKALTENIREQTRVNSAKAYKEEVTKAPYRWLFEGGKHLKKAYSNERPQLSDYDLW